MTARVIRVLVIEDDPGTGRLIRAILHAEGYVADHALTAAEGRALAFAAIHDAIVLDLGLGDRSGLDLLQEFRREGGLTPLLVLTAEAQEATIVRALDAGADEYVVKPVRHLELAARVRALLRRRPVARPVGEITVGTLTLNRLTRKALVRGSTLNLSPKEFALLEHLMEHAGEVVGRATLLERVWDMRFDPGSNVVDVHVTRLRRKLDDAGGPVRIETRRGAGFSLTAAPGAGDTGF